MLLALACGSACDDEAPLAVAWPAGTIVAVDGEPILGHEVDDHIEAMLDIQPAFGETQRRRMVLLHVTLPRAYARVHGGAPREAARAEAEGWLASLDAGHDVESQWQRLVGNWDEIGLPLWLAVRELEPGERIGVIELPGRFVVARLEGRDRNANPAHERLQVLLESFFYVERPETLVQDYLNGTLEIVDPAWSEVVPDFVEYEMKSEETERS